MRREAPMPLTCCIAAQKIKLEEHFADCFPLTAPCPAGCFGWEESCTEGVPGANSLAGAELSQWCESSWIDEAYHYVWGWANESCPYVCEDVDKYGVDNGCINVLVGQHVLACINTVPDCSTGALVAFSSSVVLYICGSWYRRRLCD